MFAYLNNYSILTIETMFS